MHHLDDQFLLLSRTGRPAAGTHARLLREGPPGARAPSGLVRPVQQLRGVPARIAARLAAPAPLLRAGSPARQRLGTRR